MDVITHCNQYRGTSDTELPQVVIDVTKAPDHCFGAREGAEDRMGREGPQLDEMVHGPMETRQIASPIRRRRSSFALFDLGAGGNSARPGEIGAQRYPLYKGAL